jgi:plastocyanin
MARRISLALAAALTAACGGSSSPQKTNGGTPGYYLSITGGPTGATFSPLSLSAPSGATVTLVNSDLLAHRIVSMVSAAGAYTSGAPAGVLPFDSGPFTGLATIVLKTDPPGGTIPDATAIPYYCEIHKAAEATPHGSIVIQSTAPPTGGGGGY